MITRPKWFNRGLALKTALTINLIPALANAQVAGSGGGGFLQGFLTLTSGTLAATLGTLAVFTIGGYMAAHRAHVSTILCTAAGIYTMTNAGNLYSLVSG